MINFTEDGNSSEVLIPGRRYAIIVAGTFGGGAVVPTIENTGQTFSIPIPFYSSLTEGAAFEFVAPSNQLTYTLSGATSPDIVIFTTLCPL